MRLLIALPGLLLLAACGGPSTPRQSAPVAGQLPPTPAAIYCQRSGGTVIARTSSGRRADLCRLPSGRTVRAADLLNSHNSL